MSNDIATTTTSAFVPSSTVGRRMEIPNCWLVLESGPDAGKRFLLGEHTTVGRDDFCDVCLDDSAVSKQHCSFSFTPATSIAPPGMRLRDLGSRNGVFDGDTQIVEIIIYGTHRYRIGQTLVRIEFETGTRTEFIAPCDPTCSVHGQSEIMKRLFGVMKKVAYADVHVLLLGETGTGKTLMARALHDMSKRKGEFVHVDCPAINPNLFEGTLLGYVRGAFTGAYRDVEGVFAQANGGTVFLDEIGDIPIELQSKLLIVLESGTVRPVGSQRAVPVDFRLICATNRDLKTMVREGKFRADLYHRLEGMTMTAPPLRERISDVAILAELFTFRLSNAARAAGEKCEVTSISREAIEVLERNDWPGNVRGLRNVIRRALILAESNVIGPEDIVFDPVDEGAAPPAPPAPAVATGGDDDAQCVAELRAEFEQKERALVERLLARTGGNVKRAAELGGLCRSAMNKLIAKHGVRPNRVSRS